MINGKVEAKILLDKSAVVLGSSGTQTINRSAGSKFTLEPTSMVTLETENFNSMDEVEVEITNGYGLITFPTNWSWATTLDYQANITSDFMGSTINLISKNGLPQFLEPSGITSFTLRAVTYESGLRFICFPTGNYRDAYRNDQMTNLLLHFNETDGAFIDSSFLNHTVENSGVTCDTSVKKFGAGSAKFDGLLSYINVYEDYVGGANSWQWKLYDYTVDFQFKCNATPSQPALLVGLYGFEPWAIWMNPDGTITLHGSANHTTTQTFNEGNWHHFAMVRTNGYAYLYDNGILILSAQEYTQTRDDYDSTRNLRVGKDYAYPSFDGWIDEVRISKGIARWKGNFTPPTAQYE